LHADSERKHLDNIRERFTRSAQVFSEFVLSRRSQEAERLAAMATENFTRTNTAVDLACGPGTFTRAFAARFRHAIGVDFTPAMLLEGREAAHRAGVANLEFVRADVNALPFAGGVADVVCCGYALHHLLAPGHVLAEMARVAAPAGRIAIADLIAPDGADSERHNRIERARDPSHASSLKQGELRELLARAGLRVLAAEQQERSRDFDHWMRVAARPPGSPAYVETRRLMEQSITGNAPDASGFRPRLDPSSGSLQLLQVAIYIVAEKIS
jgi:ubiquinone/menaquinone biosynthesis C-methylase UbiE